MYPIPTVSQLAAFSGRDESTYTGYANSALLQATLRFTHITEISDPSQIPSYNAISQADNQLLATQGILALADNIYLQYPYQQVIASPLNNESAGSYNYAKAAYGGASGSMSRMAPAALELSLEKTNIVLFDMAIQMLSLRTRAGGVFHDAVSVFDEGESRQPQLGGTLFFEADDGRRWILGPEDHNLFSVFPGMDINAPSYPQDPGI
jgi:hypothetical protein